MTHKELFVDGTLRYEGPIGDLNHTLASLDHFIDVEDDEERKAAIDAFSQDRLTSLVSAVKPQNLTFFHGVHTDFIHPESVIENYLSPLQSLFVENGLVLDDPEVYSEVAKRAVNLSRSGFLEGSPINVTVPFALTSFLGNYLGDYAPDREQTYRSNTRFSASQKRSIKDYQGTGIAVCAQIAPLTHNILTFLGYKATLVYSTENEFDGEITPHVYNLFDTSNGVTLFDPTQPGAIYTENNSHLGEWPALYPLTRDQSKSLIGGGKIIVDHRDVVLTNTGKPLQLTDEVQHRVYSGA